MSTTLPRREHPAYDLDERPLLEAFLDFHLAMVHRKVAGLSELGRVAPFPDADFERSDGSSRTKSILAEQLRVWVLE
jgi:hypothetical protein